MTMRTMIFGTLGLVAGACQSYHVVFVEELESEAAWYLNADPEVQCDEGDDQLCGTASARFVDSELSLSAGCDSGGPAPCPSATAVRALPPLNIQGLFRITAEFANLTGNGRMTVCTDCRCTAVRWSVETELPGGDYVASSINNVVLDVSETGEVGGVFTAEILTPSDAVDEIALDVSGDGGDISIWRTNTMRLRSIEISVPTN